MWRIDTKPGSLFDPRRARVAPLVERALHTGEVSGSSPDARTISNVPFQTEFCVKG